MLREEDAATSLENVATKPLEVGLACCIRLTLAAQRLLNDHVEVLLVLVCQCTSFLAHLSDVVTSISLFFSFFFLHSLPAARRHRHQSLVGGCANGG